MPLPLPPPASPTSPSRPRITWIGIVGALIVGVILWAIFFRPASPTSPSVEVPDAGQAEAPLADLVRREQKLHLRDDSLPFTGIAVERYPDATLKSRSAIRHGLLDGISEGWFTNGVLQVREEFRAGVAHGSRTRWHPNGAKASEAAIVNGQIVGLFRRWREDGTLAEEIGMDQGQPHGISRSFFPSGFIQTEARLEHGKVVEQASWADGEKRSHPPTPPTP